MHQCVINFTHSAYLSLEIDIFLTVYYFTEYLKGSLFTLCISILSGNKDLSEFNNLIPDSSDFEK